MFVSRWAVPHNFTNVDLRNDGTWVI